MIPNWKGEDICVDYIDGFPKTRQCNDSIWVIVDHLTISAQSILVGSKQITDKLAKVYVNEIVKLRGVSIVTV